MKSLIVFLGWTIAAFAQMRPKIDVPPPEVAAIELLPWRSQTVTLAQPARLNDSAQIVTLPQTPRPDDLAQTVTLAQPPRLHDVALSTSVKAPVPRLDDSVLSTSVKARAPRLDDVALSTSVKAPVPRLDDSVLSTSVKARTPRLDDSALSISVKAHAPRLDDSALSGSIDDFNSLSTFLATDRGKRVAALNAGGIEYSETRVTKALPDFMIGGIPIDLTKYPQDRHAKYSQGFLDRTDITWGLRTSNAEDRIFAENHPKAKYIVGDFNISAILGQRWLKIMQADNCQAVVLGNAYCDWKEAPSTTFDEVVAVRDYLRKITNAPILLAVSLTNADQLVTKDWIKAFASDGLEKWDGFALIGFHNFAGLRYNDRKKLAETTGIPADRPIIAYWWYDLACNPRFTGYDERRTKEVWQANAAPVLANMRKNGWRGFILDMYGRDLELRLGYLQSALVAQQKGKP